jgi:hypothetical protein
MESIKGKTDLARKAEKVAAMSYKILSPEIVIIFAKKNGKQTVQMCGHAEEIQNASFLLRKIATDLDRIPQTVGFEFPPEEVKTKLPRKRKPRARKETKDA